MKGSLTLDAPAKLNLFLHVRRRRPDGYHELETLFRLVDLCDRVTVTGSSAPGVRLATGSGGPATGNLAVRAVSALLDALGEQRLGFEVTVEKHIPQGGLGGGSSDAAAALLATNHLLGAPLDVGRLATVGLRVGADVPLFVRGDNAWGVGLGERLTALPLPDAVYVIVQPRCEVPTAAIFAHPALTRSGAALTMRGFVEIVRDGAASSMAVVRTRTRNDCEALVRSLYPEVDRAFRWLDERAPARMTGTGGCVFAEVSDEAAGRALAAAVPTPWCAFVVRGLARSPARVAVDMPGTGVS